MKRITIRLSDKDEELFNSVKKRINNESDTAVIKYMLGNFPYHDTPSVSGTHKVPENFSSKIETPQPVDENPYLLVSKGWNHELGEHTKLIKQNLKPWLSRELLESDPDFALYTIVGKPAQGDVDDVQTV